MELFVFKGLYSSYHKYFLNWQTFKLKHHYLKKIYDNYYV